VQRSCPIDADHEFVEGARVVDDVLLVISASSGRGFELGEGAV
jgi:hypothetical protein